MLCQQGIDSDATESVALQHQITLGGIVLHDVLQHAEMTLFHAVQDDRHWVLAILRHEYLFHISLSE